MRHIFWGNQIATEKISYDTYDTTFNPLNICLRKSKSRRKVPCAIVNSSSAKIILNLFFSSDACSKNIIEIRNNLYQLN